MRSRTCNQSVKRHRCGICGERTDYIRHKRHEEFCITYDVECKNGHREVVQVRMDGNGPMHQSRGYVQSPRKDVCPRCGRRHDKVELPRRFRGMVPYDGGVIRF